MDTGGEMSLVRLRPERPALKLLFLPVWGAVKRIICGADASVADYDSERDQI